MGDEHEVVRHRSGPQGDARLVTLLFADVEGSTRLLSELGEDYAEVLAGYYAILRQALEDTGGKEVGTEGDGFFARFVSARAAVTAAVTAQKALAAATWPGGVGVRVRMGLHTGETIDGPGGPVGLDVHRAARIAAAAHGGQVLVSDSVRALAEHHLPTDAVLRDLGMHPLRDLAQPQRLYQLCVDGLPREFPPIRTLAAAPNNLPTVLTSFVGRERDLDRARGLLASHRLVTLTGPGGAGKTRLALQTAACLVDDFVDGVWFVRLAPIRDPGLVPATILSAMRVPLAAQGEPRDQLLDYLRGRALLLVLDNFEQILEAAPLVSELLQAAADVRVLATSRSPLHVSGEQELPVPTLSVPDVDAPPLVDSLSNYAAVALFVERATAVRPDFALTEDNAAAVAAITARLDGLPLAIELAAARVRLLPPQAMLERLDRGLTALGSGPRDLPERQQTLRRTIAWSYDLLDAAGRRLLACLAVFVDGWTLEHVEAVCADGHDVLDATEALLDHSLVRERGADGDVRFGMLETIREFALERLGALADADRVRDRHAALFLALAEEAALHLLGREQAAWVARLDRERGNLRAAFQHFAARADGVRAARMAAALWRYWQKTAVQEGRERTATALAFVAGADTALTSAVLEAAGGLAYWAGDMAAARQHYEQALALERRLDRPGGVANALYNLAFSFGLGGEAGRGRGMFEESHRLFEEAGDRAGATRARWGIGVAAYFDGRLDAAERDLRASLASADALDDVFLAHWARHMLGMTLMRRGELEEAGALIAEALTFFADVGDVAAVTLLLDDFATLAEAQDRPERQARLAAASRALQRTSGSELASLSADLEGRTPVDPEVFTAAWRDGLALDVEAAVAYALSDAD